MKTLKNPNYLTIALYSIVSVLIIYSGIQLIDSIGCMIKGVKKIGILFWESLKPLFIAFIIAYLLDPLVCFYEKRCCSKGKRTAPLFLAFATLIGCIGLFILILFLHTSFVMNREVTAKTIWDLKENMHLLEQFLEALDQKAHEWGLLERNDLIQGIYEVFNTALTRVVDKTLDGLKEWIPQFISVGIAFVISAYLLKDKVYFLEHTQEWMERFFPKKLKKIVYCSGQALDEVFSGYIQGQLLDAGIMTLLISLALTLIRLDFAIIIGVVSGIFNVIPYFGPLVGLVLGGLMGFIGNDPKKGIYAILCIGVLQQIDGWFIVPKIMQKTIKIHPIAVILSLYIGGKYFGLMGMLLAVPIAAFIGEIICKCYHTEKCL